MFRDATVYFFPVKHVAANCVIKVSSQYPRQRTHEQSYPHDDDDDDDDGDDDDDDDDDDDRDDRDDETGSSVLLILSSSILPCSSNRHVSHTRNFSSYVWPLSSCFP